MKPALQLRLSQHLTLTPQLQQSIRLLQLSTIELNQEIERLLMENPLLEREDAEGGEHEAPPRAPRTATRSPVLAHESDPRRRPAPSRRLVRRARRQLARRAARTSEGDRDRFSHAGTPTLREHLLHAARAHQPRRARPGLRRAADRRARRGRLPDAAARGDRARCCPPRPRLELEELAIALRHLQNLEPAGVGARIARRMPGAAAEDPARRPRARASRCRSSRNHLELLASARLHAAEERHRRRRRGAARRAAADPGAQPAPRRRLRARSRRAT